MVMQRLRLSKFATHHSHLQFSERGSVTAELAIAMPAVSLVIAITLGAFALQIERMKMVDVAATAARAFAREEPEQDVRALIAELTPLGEQNELELLVQENFACVKLSKAVTLPGLGTQIFDLSETQCARKMGL